MKFLSYLLFQIDEARRYIEDGRLEHLRLAFLLLDNAAEIQMDRCIKRDLQRDKYNENLRTTLLSLPIKLPPTMQELADWEPLTSSEKYKLDRLFNEKVDYMVGRGKHLEAGLANPLKYLHRYRNEAYHRAKVRAETIKTASLILLEINCQMILSVSPGPRLVSSDEDYSWFEERFHTNRFASIDIGLIANEIRSGLLPSDETVATTLADHLQDRFSYLNESLESIVENSRLKDREDAFNESQYYAESQRSAHGLSRSSFQPKYSLHSIREMESQLPQIRNAPNRLEAFNRFAAIEIALEPVEECVSKLADWIEEEIQLEIDIARGK